MSIWHNLVGVLIGIALFGAGRLISKHARQMADWTIHFETSWPKTPADWGSEHNRKVEAAFNRMIGRLVAGLDVAVGLICAGQLIYRLVS